MKKIFSVLLAAMMVFSMSVTAFAADFKDTVDVPQSEAIDVIETLGIVDGYGNGVFGPHDTLTRAQLCTMLTRALYGDPIYTSTNQFKDVAPTHWANAYINTAYAYGLMAGYGGGYFGPEDEITYTQMAAVIMKALGYDCGKMSWPTGVNSMGHTLGLFDNVKFADYSNGCTRAHAAQMIYNAFDLNYVNHKADYPVSIKHKTFLEDGLGFEKTIETVNGHQFDAYIDLDDGEIYVTENCLTYEQIIYPVDGYNYHFKNSSKSHAIDWYWFDNEVKHDVVLYVNGTEITSGSETKFAACDKAIGVFDDDDNLMAIYIESAGIDYIYGIAPDAVADRNMIYEIVKNDKNYDQDNSTVTYFAESEDYIISNKVDYGWVTGAYKSAIYVDGVKIAWDNNPVVFTKGEFVKMFYNYRNELVAIQSFGTDPYVYDVTDKIYHTFECDHVSDNVDCSIVHYSDLAVGTHTFKECSKCHANEGTLKITIKAPEVEAPIEQ